MHLQHAAFEKDLVPVKILCYNVKKEGLEHNMQVSYFEYLKKVRSLIVHEDNGHMFLLS